MSEEKNALQAESKEQGPQSTGDAPIKGAEAQIVEEVHVLDEETGETVAFEIEDQTPKVKDVSEIKEVNVKATVSNEDYYVAHINYIFYRRGIIRAAFLFAIVIFLDLIVRYFIPGMEITTGLLILVILTALVVSIGLPMLLKSQIGKAYEKNIFYAKHLRYSISDKRVAVASKSRGKKIPWEKFKYIRQTEDFFLFVVDGTHAVVLPIRVLSGIQVQAIRNLILKNTANNKKIKVKLP